VTRKKLVVKVPVPAVPHAGTPALPPAGRRVRANGTRKKTVYLPDYLCLVLRRHCAEADTDETKVVVAALRQHLGLD
jgi:hypothetical protein